MASKEIFFACPLCTQPLVARLAEAGQEADCPHCFKLIRLPSSSVEVIDKNRFEEPFGLRRILLEIRNVEWEKMRRKLHEARARIAELERQLDNAHGRSRASHDLEEVAAENASALTRSGRRSDGFCPSDAGALAVA